MRDLLRLIFMTDNRSADAPPHLSYELSLLLLIDLQCRLRRLYISQKKHSTIVVPYKVIRVGSPRLFGLTERGIRRSIRRGRRFGASWWRSSPRGWAWGPGPNLLTVDIRCAPVDLGVFRKHPGPCAGLIDEGSPPWMVDSAKMSARCAALAMAIKDEPRDSIASLFSFEIIYRQA